MNMGTLKNKLFQVQKKSSEMFVWAIKNDHVIKASAKIIILRDNNLRVKIDKQDLPYLMNIFSGSLEVNFLVPDLSLIFQSEFVSFDDETLSVRTTGFFKTYERRMGERIDPLVNVKVEFNIQSKMVLKEVFDLSEGGFSIVLAQSDRIKFDETEYEVKAHYLNEVHSCKVKLLEELKLTPFMIERCPYAGRRFSFKFIKIETKFKEKIKDMVAASKNLSS